MIIQVKDDIFKLKHQVDIANSLSHGLLVASYTSNDPKGYKTAARTPHWVHAMKDKLEALCYRNTFTLVPRSQNLNVVGSKCIFRTKISR